MARSGAACAGTAGAAGAWQAAPPNNPERALSPAPMHARGQDEQARGAEGWPEVGGSWGERELVKGGGGEVHERWTREHSFARAKQKQTTWTEQSEEHTAQLAVLQLVSNALTTESPQKSPGKEPH